jgi:hypothetical protein
MSTQKRNSAAPLIVAILLLLLPVLYVGSYLALVVRKPVVAVSLTFPTQYSADFYRVGGDYAETFYWPLEKFDRWLQPDAWDDGFERIGIDFSFQVTPEDESP